MGIGFSLLSTQADVSALQMVLSGSCLAASPCVEQWRLSKTALHSVKLQSEKSCVTSAMGKLWCDQSFKITYMLLTQIAVEGSGGKALEEETVHFAWNNENQLFQTSHPVLIPFFQTVSALPFLQLLTKEGLGRISKGNEGNVTGQQEVQVPVSAPTPSLASAKKEMMVAGIACISPTPSSTLFLLLQKYIMIPDP